MKKTRKFIFGLLFISFFALFLVFNISEANAEIIFNPNVRIPGTDFGSSVAIDGDSIGKYIKSLYEYGAVFVGAVAMFMLVFAGWQWLMAAGSSDKIGRAKETINGVLVGLILLFGGYLLLSQISTNLVQFKSIALQPLVLDTVADEKCESMNNKIKSGTAPTYLNPTNSGINPNNENACGQKYILYKTNEDGTPDFNQKDADCVYNLASADNFSCLQKSNDAQMADGPCLSVPIGPSISCVQLADDCNQIWARPENQCEKYKRIDYCISNKCHDQHQSYECGVDQNNPNQNCEKLDDVWCGASDYCDFNNTAKWCCEDSSGTDYCRIDENNSSDTDQKHTNNCRST